MNISGSAGVRGIIHGLLIIFAVTVCVQSHTHAAAKTGSDLFEQPYVYLIKGDEKFLSLAVNYSHTVPSPDSMFHVVTKPLSRKLAGTAATNPQHLELVLGRPMAVRIIVADSAVTFLIAFEFKNVPAGTYTLGSRKWPEALRRQISGLVSVSLFIAADQRFRDRFTFDMDSSDRMIRTSKYRATDR